MQIQILRAMAVCLAVVSGAAASADPPGVTSADGIFRRADGRPLYYNDNDLLDRSSTCNGACAIARPPLLAAEGDKDDRPWLVIARQDGTRMWSLLNRPLYAFIGDEPNGPATGAGGPWRPAFMDSQRAVAGGRVSTSPHPSPDNEIPDYPEVARMIHAEGVSGMTMCVDQAGKPSQIGLVESSGYDVLDIAALDWSKRLKLLPGKVDGAPGMVCGYVLQYDWQLREN